VCDVVVSEWEWERVRRKWVMKACVAGVFWVMVGRSNGVMVGRSNGVMVGVMVGGRMG